MNIENQVCSLEQAKKLKELGIIQKSLFSYTLSEFGIVNGVKYTDKIYLTDGQIFKSHNQWAAFTVSELLELLPLINGSPMELLKGATFSEGITYWCRNLNLDINDYSMFKDKNPSNACAKMLIYLLENKLITVEKINKETICHQA